MSLNFSHTTSSQDVRRALEVVGEILQEENIKICAKESAKGGLITGVSALIGGLLGGKAGLLAGMQRIFDLIIYSRVGRVQREISDVNNSV